jgi:hypothetical protein
MITNVVRYKIKSQTAMAEAAFNKKTVHQQTGLTFREATSNLEHSFTWCRNFNTLQCTSEIP